jgi:hypothetical protein
VVPGVQDRNKIGNPLRCGLPEPVKSRLLGHNWQPVVPGVQDRDKTGNPLRCGLPGSLIDWIYHGEPCPYQGELIRCQSDCDDYACSHGEVAMSGGDGMGPNTRVAVARHAWVLEVTSCLVWH